jgi:hypothetical protein
MGCINFSKVQTKAYQAISFFYCGSPFGGLGVPCDTYILRSAMILEVRGVLTPSTDSNIGSAIIKPIVIYMVNHEIFWAIQDKPMHSRLDAISFDSADCI